MKFIFLSILILSEITFAQFKVSGKVTDVDGKALPGVNVFLEGTNLGAATDSDGSYEISNIKSGNYSIIFSLIGYTKKIIPVSINNNISLNAVLEIEPIRSQQVVITAGKYEQQLSELPVSAELIQSEELLNKNYINLREALKYVPGINMVEDQISIRGSSGYSRGAGTRVLVAIDGIPFYTGDTGEIIWEIIPITQIERVEIIKGAASSLYGSTAIGGVINIITKDIPDNHETYARGLFGVWDEPAHEEWDWSNTLRSYNGLTLSHANNIGDFGFNISLTRLRDLSFRENGFFTRYISFIKSRYKISDFSSVTLIGNTLNHETGNFIYWKSAKDALVPPDADLGQKTRAGRYMIGLIYNNILTNNFLINIRTSYYRTNWEDETTSQNNSKTNLLRGEVQTNYSINSNIILVSGIEGTSSNVKSNIFGNPSSKGFGIYSQFDIKFNFPLSASIGARYDFSKLDSLESFSDFSPKLGLNYNLNDKLILRSSIGKGFRAPSLAEAFTSTTASGITVRPNPNLISENNFTAEFGINYQLNESINLDAAVFQNEFYDFIEPNLVVDNLGNNYGQFQNITRARIQGYETNVRLSFLDDDLLFGINYTYLWSRDLGNEKALKYRPRHLAYLNGSYSFLNFETGFSFRYHSRFEEIDTELVELVPILDGEKRVPVYVIDLRAGYNFLSTGFPARVFINANNILNYNYVELIGNIAPIRNYSISLELMF